MKVHAQETILYDEMVKELAKSRLSREQQQAEESFKHHIDQYRQRTALILEQKRVRSCMCVCVCVCIYICVCV
jgi:indole-3-glycerol phosphate synthase